MKLFVVIPLFNEEKHIASVLKGISSYKLPVVVVNDGSTDKSFRVLKSSKVKNVKVLTHKINLGKGAAMKTGAEYAFANGAEAVIFMDSDGQHSPDDLSKFIKALDSGKYGMVFGSRNMGFNVPLVRFLGNKIASVVVTMLFRIYVSDSLCGFRALTKAAYGKVKWDSRGYGVEVEMIVRAGKNKIQFTEVSVDTVYHDSVKGVTMLDAFVVMGEVIKWRLTL